jgi:hypothetical protein
MLEAGLVHSMLADKVVNMPYLVHPARSLHSQMVVDMIKEVLGEQVEGRGVLVVTEDRSR